MSENPQAPTGGDAAPVVAPAPATPPAPAPVAPAPAEPPATREGLFLRCFLLVERAIFDVSWAPWVKLLVTVLVLAAVVFVLRGGPWPAV